MPRSKKIMFCILFVIGLCAISSLFISWKFQQVDNFEAWPARNPIADHLKDPESLISIKLKHQRLISKGQPSNYNSRTVEIGMNARDTLGNIARNAFAEQHSFRQRLAGIPTGSNGIILNNAIIKDLTYEFEDSYLVIKSTSINVVDPRALSARSSQFNKFLGRRKRPESVKLSSLDAESLRGMDDFIKNELSKRPLDDPLKIAASQGQRALLQAIIAGKGLFETVEELVVPKKSLPKVNRIPQLPVFKDGFLHFNRRQPSKLPLLSSLDPRRAIKKDLIKKLPANMPVILQAEQKPGTPRHMKKVATGQTAGFNAYFLTGYRLGDSASFEWARKWKFPSGLFRVKMHAGYDLALRFPIEVKGQIRPRTVTITGANDMRSSFDTIITAKPVDGDRQFYENAGYDPNQLPEKTRGKELAVYFGFGYGFKFRALWTTVVPWRYYSHEYDWSKDFLPPYNLNEGGINITIPSSVTNTSFSAGDVKGDLNAVIKLGGKGKIHLDYESFHHLTGEAPRSLSRKRLTFSNPNPITTTNSVPPMPFEKNAVDNYGFKLFNPKYEVRPSITPGVKVAVTLGYKDFSRTIKYGPVFFRALELLIPPITFDVFPDSYDEYVWDHGRKYFKKR